MKYLSYSSFSNSWSCKQACFCVDNILYRNRINNFINKNEGNAQHNLSKEKIIITEKKTYHIHTFTQMNRENECINCEIMRIVELEL